MAAAKPPLPITLFHSSGYHPGILAFFGVRAAGKNQNHNGTVKRLFEGQQACPLITSSTAAELFQGPAFPMNATIS